jgi:hypothetical protein
VAEGKYDDQIAAMVTQINQLQRENHNMQKALAEVAYANVLPSVLEHGFNNVIEQLRPLRDLTPQRGSVDPEIAQAAAAMLNAMEGVKLKGDSLEIRPVSVPYIGEVRRPVPSRPGPYPSQPDASKHDPYRTDPSKTTDQTIEKQPARGGYRP